MILGLMLLPWLFWHSSFYPMKEKKEGLVIHITEAHRLRMKKKLLRRKKCSG